MFGYFCRGFRARRRGQTLTEYAIIVALVAVASIAVVTIFGNEIRVVFAFMAKRIAGHHDDPKAKGDQVVSAAETVLGAEMDDWPVDTGGP